MTTIPAIERIEKSQCSICTQNCIRLCVRCGSYFCNRHLLVHSSACDQKYYQVIKTILHDAGMDMVKQVFAFAIPSL